MALKILHTADWHIGQTFYEYDRIYEHQQFLHWLVKTITTEKVDALLMSGDVFDVSNPAATSVTLFYRFLKEVTVANPGLQVIMIAGNHDSAARLAAPQPLLDAFHITIVGNVERLDNGEINYEKLIIPLQNQSGETCAWCMAIPFLRPGDYPAIPDAVSPYAEGITELYKEVYALTSARRQAGQAILAMGHLHTLNAEISENDKSERLIMGGIEFVPASAFHENITYTALGHIHKAQKIGGKEHVRYSGSPLPMSFSEINYRHQVVLVEIEAEQVTDIRLEEIPVTVALLRLPTVPKPLKDVLLLLEQLPEDSDDREHSPYLEVRVLLEGPEPALRYKIESALQKKQVRLAKIDVQYPTTEYTGEEAIKTYDQLLTLQPGHVFNKIYRSRYNSEVPPELTELFNQVLQEVDSKEKTL